MEWSTIRRARSCATCGRDFTEGEDYYSQLFWREGAMAREDYCGACSRPLDPGAMDGCLSHWKGRFKAPPEKPKPEIVAGSRVERLLRKYIDSDDPAHVNVRYILCLMMERRKKLVPRDTVTDPQSAKKLVVYEMPKTGETFLIEDPGLRISHAREIQKQVRELLASEGG